MSHIVNFEKLIEKWSGQTDWCSVRLVEQKQSHISVRNQKADKTQIFYESGVMIEVIHAGYYCYGASSDMHPDHLDQLFQNILERAKRLHKWAIHSFDHAQVRPSTRGEYRSPVTHSLRELSSSDIQERLLSASQHLAGKNIIQSSALSIKADVKTSYLSSSGAHWQQDFDIISYNLAATAQDPSSGEVQNRSLGLRGGQWGQEVLDAERLKSEAQRIQQQARELLHADDCPSGQYDLILTPDQLYLQVHESIGHPLELDRILGDERNYAGWSFVNKEDFGTLQWGPEILNVSYDPTLSGEMASFQFDDNGALAKKEMLIEKGKLLRGIGGVESQVRSQIPGVSCARATSWNRPAIDRMGNINIEPGESSIEEMIESCERGILMQTNCSWSIDDYRNKFQFGCEYAQLIEQGRITKTLKNPNYRGQTVPFWNSLTHVGNRESFEVWGSPYCGKGEPNQIIRVGHAIPTCRFKNIEVFGGAS